MYILEKVLFYDAGSTAEIPCFLCFPGTKMICFIVPAKRKVYLLQSVTCRRFLLDRAVFFIYNYSINLGLTKLYDRLSVNRP